MRSVNLLLKQQVNRTASFFLPAFLYGLCSTDRSLRAVIYRLLFTGFGPSITQTDCTI